MDTDKEQIKALLEGHDRLTHGMASIKDVKELVNVLLSAIKELKSKLEKDMFDNNKDMMNTHTEMMTSHRKMMSDMTIMERDMKGMMSDMQKGEMKNIEEVRKRLTGEIEKIRASMPTMPDLSVLEGKLEAVKASIPVIKDTILDNPVQIREKVQSLPIGERWEIEDVNDLRKELNELRKRISTAKGITIFGGGGGGGGRIVKAYDFTSQLNGVLKTFPMPAFYRIISVHSSSFPYVFRETTDYTYDASAMTITFTDEIIADSTLAEDQTLTVIYSEP